MVIAIVVPIVAVTVVVLRVLIVLLWRWGRVVSRSWSSRRRSCVRTLFLESSIVGHVARGCPAQRPSSLSQWISTTTQPLTGRVEHGIRVACVASCASGVCLGFRADNQQTVKLMEWGDLSLLVVGFELLYVRYPEGFPCVGSPRNPGRNQASKGCKSALPLQYKTAEMQQRKSDVSCLV